MKLKTTLILMILLSGCSKSEDVVSVLESVIIDYSNDEVDNPNVTYADINFSNWKVKLLTNENNNGSPDEHKPSELLKVCDRTNVFIEPYIHDGLEHKLIEFYTTLGLSISSSSNCKTELRELINKGGVLSIK